MMPGAKLSVRKPGQFTQRQSPSFKPFRPRNSSSEFRRIQKRKCSFLACPLRLCASGEMHVVFLLLLNGSKYGDGNLRSGRSGRPLDFLNWFFKARLNFVFFKRETFGSVQK